MFRLFKAKRSDPQAELKTALGGSSLPSFPVLVLKALEALRSPNASTASVGSMLATDPGLTVKILRQVNSAAYSPARRVTSIRQAATLMGVSALESLLLSVAISDSLPRHAAQGFDSPRFWRAAARRATLARGLADLLHPKTRTESYSAGLLQDMAIPLLAHSGPTNYGLLLEHWHESEETLHELERAELGWDHPEVATWICAEWDLPESLGIAIGSHHQSSSNFSESDIAGGHRDTADLAGETQVACPPAVKLAGYLRESEERLGIEELIESARSHYGLASDQIIALIDESFAQADDLASLIAA